MVDALYRRAEVFCVASLYEGFGLPALEAMARSAPTIVTTGSSMEEFVTGAGMLFPPRDVDACVQAIDRLLDDEDYRDELRRAPLEDQADASIVDRFAAAPGYGDSPLPDRGRIAQWMNLAPASLRTALQQLHAN